MAINIYNRGNVVIEVDDSTKSEPYFFNWRKVNLRSLGDIVYISEASSISQVVIDYNDVANVSALSGVDLIQKIAELFEGAGGCASIQGVTTQYANGTFNQNEMPFNGFYDFGVSGVIYLQSELGSAKQFTGLQVETAYNESSPQTQLNQKIYIAHCVESQFNSSPQIDISDLTISDQVLVYDGNFFTGTTADWYGITFDTNFCYNGTSNIVILWENRDGAYTFDYRTFETDISTASNNKGFYKRKDNSYPEGSGTRVNQRYNLKLIY